MEIWRDNLITRKAEMMPSFENMTPEMEKWTEAIVKRLLQAA
jgi:hypothetical protein